MLVCSDAASAAVGVKALMKALENMPRMAKAVRDDDSCMPPPGLRRPLGVPGYLSIRGTPAASAGSSVTKLNRRVGPVKGRDVASWPKASIADGQKFGRFRSKVDIEPNL